MRTILIVLLVLVLLFAAVFVILGMMLDSNYDFERSVLVAAPVESIRPLVADLRAWDQWTPWTGPDTPLKVVEGAQSTGVDATRSWIGEDGGNQVTITQSDPKTGIEYEMLFFADDRRFTSLGSLRYAPEGGGTRVTWSMRGSSDTPIMGGMIAASMEKRFGPLFEKGLMNLKSAAEQAEPGKPRKPDKSAVDAGKDG